MKLQRMMAITCTVAVLLMFAISATAAARVDAKPKPVPHITLDQATAAAHQDSAGIIKAASRAPAFGQFKISEHADNTSHTCATSAAPARASPLAAGGPLDLTHATTYNGTEGVIRV